MGEGWRVEVKVAEVIASGPACGGKHCLSGSPHAWLPSPLLGCPSLIVSGFSQTPSHSPVPTYLDATEPPGGTACALDVAPPFPLNSQSSSRASTSSGWGSSLRLHF